MNLLHPLPWLLLLVRLSPRPPLLRLPRHGAAANKKVLQTQRTFPGSAFSFPAEDFGAIIGECVHSYMDNLTPLAATERGRNKNMGYTK